MIEHWQDDVTFYGLNPAERQHYARRLAAYYGMRIMRTERRERARERRGKIIWWTLASFAVLWMIIQRLLAS